MSLLSWLADRARTTAEKPFLIEGGKTWSYGDVYAASQVAAAHLIELGVRPGDRVLLGLPNGIEHCISTYGILYAGATVALVNPRFTQFEIEQFARICTPHLAIADPLNAAFANMSLKRVSPTALRMAARSPNGPRASPQGLAFLLPTSGTTGEPKAVMLEDAAVTANALQMARRKEISEEDRALCSLPLFHCSGQVAALQSIMVSGASMVILKVITPELILNGICSLRASIISGVPAVYQNLIALNKRMPVDLSSLRLCLTSSAPMPLELIARVERELGGYILESYGLTECSAGVTGNPVARRKHGTVGPALPDTEIKIIDEAGAPLEAGRAGEVYIRGPQLMAGYFGNPAATREVLTEDGWFKSGDLGDVDSEGYLTIRSRKKDFIKCSGFGVYPAEVENVVREVDGVTDATVIGLPDRLSGETVHVAII
ncbi:MAG TPA: AMP-binding protein, partial [Bdellovibrionales bacterium]|nr:AMP-binding protein [Bdellovibrionales bacterium]